MDSSDAVCFWNVVSVGLAPHGPKNAVSRWVTLCKRTVTEGNPRGTRRGGLTPVKDAAAHRPTLGVP